MVRLSKSLQKTLRRCTEEEIRDLTEAMKNDKYWSGIAGKRNMIYVLALTKAIVPLSEGFQARTTFLGKVPVTRAASPYCKPGCILAVVKSGSQYLAQSVITWPAFLRIMRGNAKEVYDLLLSNKFPPYVGCSDLVKIIRTQHLEPPNTGPKSLEETGCIHSQ